MKVLARTALMLLAAFAAVSARAQQGPDSQFVTIYGLIQQADALLDSGQPRPALADYLAAKTELDRFAVSFPDWSPDIIAFRERYLADQIVAAKAQLPPGTAELAPAANATAGGANQTPAKMEAQLADLRQQVQNLRNDNANLAAKLKEALTAQPAAADPGQLAADQEKILALMKENDLLRANLAVQKAPAPKMTRAESRKQADELREKVKTLEARLAVYEAQAVPYTAEERALFQAGAPMPDIAPAAAAAPIDHHLPAGSDDLIASAKAHFAAHDYDAAAADYKKVLAMDKENAYIQANLAIIAVHQGRLDDAEKLVKSSLAKEPNDPFTLYVQGDVKFQQGKYAEALDSLSRAAQLDPKNPQTESLLGVCLGMKGLRQQAETAFRTALIEDPDFAPAHFNLAQVYLDEKPPRPELARWHYLKALANGQPHNPAMEKTLADEGAAIPAQ